jgi:hypothetical protein
MVGSLLAALAPFVFEGVVGMLGGALVLVAVLAIKRVRPTTG